MPKFSPLRSAQDGFSLIEVMIAAALLGGLSFFAISLTHQGMKGQKTISATDEARSITAEMASLLSNPTACADTFGGQNPAEGFNLTGPVKNGTGGTAYSIGSIYGNRTVKLTSISVGGPGVDPKTSLTKFNPASTGSAGSAMVIVNWNKTSDTIGAAGVPRFFFMNVSLDASNNITGCFATGGSGDLIWVRNPGDASKIYYDDGFVGIGSALPGTALDVNGGIRPGDENSVTNCGTGKGNGEGAQRYNYTKHYYEYCDGTTWSKLGGFSKCQVFSAPWDVSCPAGWTLVGGSSDCWGNSANYNYITGFQQSPSGTNSWHAGCMQASPNSIAHAFCCQ